ncbi:MAG: hypothetical protein NDF57_06050 [archaeon GBS-70-058]|nr:hypothetical protein [Candidatus Culexarchaeum nevadense]
MGFSSVDVWDEFNIDISLKASFTLPIFSFHNGYYVKFYGYKSGLALKVDSGRIIFSGCTPHESLLLSGAWFNPNVYVKSLGRVESQIIYDFLNVFPGLGIAVDPWDPLIVFYSIFLSRNTDYHNNTVRWVRNIALKALCETNLPLIDLKFIGSSYQLHQLNEIKGMLVKTFGELDFGLKVFQSSNVFSQLKFKLLRIPNIGCKSVYAFGLFCFGLTFLSPVDRHLISIIRLLGLINDYVLPDKRLCVKYDCYINPLSCINANKCLMAILMRRFKVMAGWLQTASYLYGSLYLSRGVDPIKLLKR